MSDPRPAALFLDLDGTLVDTAPDLAAALNRVRREEGLPAVDEAEVRPVVSHGGGAVVTAGLGVAPEEPGHAELLARLLDHYQRDIARHSRLFPGLAEVLAEWEATGRPWGVVTNKPARFTEPLLEALGLAGRVAAVVSGDTLPRAKPHPDPLLHACTAAGCAPAAAIYVGDAERDIAAGLAAGLRTAVAGWGYLDPADRPGDWGAEVHLTTPADLGRWLAGSAA
ncbi:MAG: phosphoglycolate phosphatase [Thiohalospira sp.]